MNGVNHRDEVVVRDVVDDAVRGAGDPAAAGFQGVHVVFHILCDILAGARRQRPLNIDVAVQGHPVAVAFFVIAV